MHIDINNVTMRVSDETVRQVIRCHKEGWNPVNIASICRTKPVIVKKILDENNLL